MTFESIVSRVLARTKQSSDEATERIGQCVNDKHREVTSDCGLELSRRTTLSVALLGATDVDLPDVTVDLTKVTQVRLQVTNASPRLLKERDYDDLTAIATTATVPTQWAVKNILSTSVIFTLDGFQAANFTLLVEGDESAVTLVADDEPVFNEDFHDLLVEGVVAIELRIKEKESFAKIAQNMYDRRVAQLKMNIAKSPGLTRRQGQRRRTNRGVVLIS